MANNTFLGLQPYTEEDAYRFKGRTEESQELFRLIVRNDFTVCYAESGEGKTSLLNAGVFPLLRQNMYFPIAITFTSDDYERTPDSFNTIIDRCIRDSIAEYNEKNQGINVEYQLCSTDFQDLDSQANLQQALSQFSWWKLRNYKPQAMGLTFTPVFIFDQFEEVFNLPGSIVWTKKFFDWLEEVSSDSCPDDIIKKVRSIIGDKAAFPTIKEEKDFKAVFSLRKEFIGELDYWSMQKCFIPSLKDNRYCLKALTYEGAKKVMTQQQRFEENKVKQVLHYFVQLYSREAEKTIDENLPVIPALLLSVVCDSWEKDIAAFAKLSTDEISQSLNKNLEKFYDETIETVVKELVSQNREAVSSDLIRKDIDTAMFDLVDVNGKRVRVKAVTTLGTISMNSGKRFSETLPIVKYKEILNHHRIIKITKIDGEDYVEIVHDSLCPIITKRREIRLATEAKEREKKLRKKNKQLLFGSLLTLLLLAIISLILWDGLYHNIEKHYGIVIKRNGWYEGLEEISVSEASFRNCHYVLKFHGRWEDHPYAMEARDGYGKLTTDHVIKNLIVDQYEEADTGADSIMFEELKTVCQWIFIRNEAGDFVIQEQWLNKKGRTVVSNNRASTDDGRVINTYTDDYGFPIMLRDSMYFYVRTSYDEKGYENLIEFFDDQGMPIVNKDSVFQIKKEYLSNGILKSEYGCFFDGRPTMSKNNNSGFVVTQFTSDSLRCKELAYLDDGNKFCKPTNRNSTIEKLEYDIHGRVLEESYWNEFGQIITDSGIHALCKEYNEHGQTIREYYLNAKREKWLTIDSLIEIRYQYDKYGNEILREYVYPNQIKVLCYDYLEDGTCIKQEIFATANKYVIVDNKIKGIPKDFANRDTLYEYRYYSDVDNKKELYMYEDYCIRIEKDCHGNPIQVSYYDAQNKKPIERNGYHKNCIVYNYQGPIVNYTDTYYNENKERVIPQGGTYAILKVNIDSITKSRSCLEYDNEENYLTGYRNYYDDNQLEHCVTQESINEDWKTIRTYKNDLFYYRAKMLYSLRQSHSGNPIGWYAEGELGEPSLVFENSTSNYVKVNHHDNLFKDVDMSKNENIINSDVYWEFLSCISIRFTYYATLSYQGRDQYFNEHGRSIDPSKDNWPVMPFVEILEADHKLGFCDGDIVLACNNWKLKTDFNDNNSELPWLKFIERVFVVARVNDDGTAFKSIVVKVPADVDIDKYVRFKKMRCTSYEVSNITPLLEKLQLSY